MTSRLLDLLAKPLVDVGSNGSILRITKIVVPYVNCFEHTDHRKVHR